MIKHNPITVCHNRKMDCVFIMCAHANTDYFCFNKHFVFRVTLHGPPNLWDTNLNFRVRLRVPNMKPKPILVTQFIWDFLHSTVGFCFLSAWATVVKQTGVTTQQQPIQTLRSRPLNSETNQTWCCLLSWRRGRARVKEPVKSQALMMEMEDKLRVLGDSSPQQTHLWESGDAIEFSNICLYPTTHTASTDPINHRNELLRTYKSPRSDASRYSCNSLLSSGQIIFKRTLRNFAVQTVYWQNSCFQRLTFSLQRTFSFLQYIHRKTSLSCIGEVVRNKRTIVKRLHPVVSV